MGLIEKLPLRAQAPVARVMMRVRGLKVEAAWTFDADGLRTAHYSPFRDDAAWSAAYEEMAVDWFDGNYVDARWRMWVLTECARLADRPGASFAEFGVYRAGCAFMILAQTSTPRLFLFDTFGGIPNTHLSDRERLSLLQGERLADTSVGFVRQRLDRWADRIELVVGDMFETLEHVETGPLAFAHVDVNATAPTVRALAYAWERLVPGGLIVLDDYAYNDREYEEQRAAVDTYLASRGGRVITLPTGQGVLFKVH